MKLSRRLQSMLSKTKQAFHHPPRQQISSSFRVSAIRNYTPLSIATITALHQPQRFSTRLRLHSPQRIPTSLSSAHLQHYSSSQFPPTMDDAPPTSEARTETEKNPSGTEEPGTAGSSSETPAPAALPLPALPPTNDGTPQKLEVDGAALRLDHLGPLVVNVDGSLSRIANWDKMADIERENTLRIVGKRNQSRLAKLRAAGQEPSKSEVEG